jgi:DNA-binding Lrp family transcriptional regulator
MNLRPNDLKLLTYLYHNVRDTYATISKKTGLSREQVSYKIEKYQKEGLIRRYVPIFNHAAFGYRYNVTLFFCNPDPEKIIKSKYCISWGRVYAKYRIYVNCTFVDEKSFLSFLEKSDIQPELVIHHQYSRLYPLKILNNDAAETYEMNETISEKSFDKKDLLFIKELTKNSRARIIDLASAAGISSELALYKLRKLKSEKILTGSRIQFNMKKLGYYFTLIFIEGNMQLRTKIQRYCASAKNVNSLFIQTNYPQFGIQIFHKTEDEMRKAITDIQDHILEAKIEIIPIGEDQDLINVLPFL